MILQGRFDLNHERGKTRTYLALYLYTIRLVCIARVLIIVKQYVFVLCTLVTYFKYLIYIYIYTRVCILYKPEKLFGLGCGLYLIFRTARKATRVIIVCPSYIRGLYRYRTVTFKSPKRPPISTDRYFLLKRVKYRHIV